MLGTSIFIAALSVALFCGVAAAGAEDFATLSLDQKLKLALEVASPEEGKRVSYTAIDRWIAGQPAPQPFIPEAIRRLVEIGLKAKEKR
jgi:hypothetical protein